MTIRTLLASASQDPGREARLNLACDIARAFDAEIIGAGSASVEQVLDDAFAVGAMTGEVATLYQDMAESEVRDNRANFERTAAARGVQARWTGGVGYPAAIVNAAARAADLVLVAARSPGVPFRAPDPVEVISGAGRPVLVVPTAPVRTPVGSPAVLAWKDSRECRLAAAAALPLLRRASRTHVLTVSREEDVEAASAGLAEVQAWLSRHDVKASSEVLIRNDIPAARRLLDRATTLEAGLIVAGAYGHLRLTEWVLGGVTRSFLADSPLCLLMAR
ncbi:MAG: universal stress protein [Brevundimonas sp.]|jgi:nucleotide-binding universal stress UspA family protein|uniref:universal stress protein n=1 Tax=Brevundimonas sp. TaxID=1871086 RepID=UPI0025C28013|nr:universal stress protein [Brevundimonas sp.]MCH4267280.1 universal stress protein [Brevundimonas sp.]